MKNPKPIDDITRGIEKITERLTQQDKRTNSYPEDKEEMVRQRNIFVACANAILRPRGEAYILDGTTSALVSLLIAYLNGWCDYFAHISEALERSGMLMNGNINQPLMLLGDKGVGKTLLMQVGQGFAEVMGLWNRWYTSTSSSELLNHFRANGNIDYYTYQTKSKPVDPAMPLTGLPRSVCLNDLGIERDTKQMHFGTDLAGVVDEFLLARYELYQSHGLMCHITSNLTLDDIDKLYPSRVVDRLTQSNVITWSGESKR